MFDDAFVSQTEVDGWCILSDGKDTLRVGYVAVVDPASGVIVLPDKGSAASRCATSVRRSAGPKASRSPKLGGEEQNRTYGSIAATGFRRADPNSPLYGGLGVLEFGFVMERSFEHLSNLEFELDDRCRRGRPGRPRDDRRRSFEFRRHGSGSVRGVPVPAPAERRPGFRERLRRLARRHLGLQRPHADSALHARHQRAVPGLPAGEVRLRADRVGSPGQ